jgi:FAS-associated factor 2
VHRFFNALFPPHKFDGLSPAVTSQAAEDFSAYLLGLVPSISELPWAPLGFLACKNEAIQNNALLLIYLHSPLHREAENVARKFCRDEIVSQLLNPHLVALGVSIHSAQGEQLAQLLGATAYPLLAVLQPTRGSNAMELILKVQGPALVELSVPNLMGLLQSSLHRHEQMLAEVEIRRLQRQQESELRAEQDAEYQAALQADQERQRLQRKRRTRGGTVERTVSEGKSIAES